MTRPAATILAIVAAILTAAPRSFAATPAMLVGRLCSAHPASLPLPSPRRDRDCPDACHAACARTSRGECDEDGSD